MTRYTMLLLAGLLAGCTGSSDGTPPLPVALVAVGKAETAAVAETIAIYGVVEMDPAGERVLAAPVEAVLQAIDAPVGSWVQRGQVIAHLAASPAARVDLAKASTDARAADAAEARARRLRADGLVGDAEVETAHAAASSADALRDSLAARNQALLLTAPLAGYVAAIAPRPGELVAAGSAVATVARADRVRAHLGIEPTLARRVRPHAELTIAPAAGGAPVRSRILSISPVADPQTRLASVFGHIDANTDFSAGVALKASLTLDAEKGELTIPYGALLDDGGQPFVFAVVDGTAHRRDVVTGAAGQDRIVIISGLKAGDVVVTQGGTAVDDGMKVRLK